MKNFNYNISESKSILKYVFILFIIIILIITAFKSFYVVNTGEVAIIKTFGKISNIAHEGLNFKIPFIQTATNMEIREHTYTFTKPYSEHSTSFDIPATSEDTSLLVSTKDLQTVNIEFAVQASINDPEKLYKSFNGLHENSFIRPRVREIVQATIAKYTIEEFVSKRTEISQLILKNLFDDFQNYGLTVSNISIINHDFSDEYEKAIEGKKIAEQAVEKAKAEQDKLLLEASNKVKLAEFELKQKELQAKANLIESESLTPNLLEKMKIEKWDGVLPRVNGTSTPIINID